MEKKNDREDADDACKCPIMFQGTWSKSYPITEAPPSSSSDESETTQTFRMRDLLVKNDYMKVETCVFQEGIKRSVSTHLQRV